MSESVETEGASAFQRFDCVGSDPTEVAEAAEAAQPQSTDGS